MNVVVPFAGETPKTRLEPALDPDERVAFARTMLADVLSAIDDAGHEPAVLSTAPVDLAVDVPVLIDDRPLTPAVNAQLAAATEPIGVVMADLALATPAAIDRLCSQRGEVVIAPGRGGGTNALVVRHPEFQVDYHGGSYLDHRAIGDEIGADVEPVDSFRLASDVDEPADLVEVLVHGSGRSADWLRDRGFELDTSEGRVGVTRVGRPINDSTY